MRSIAAGLLSLLAVAILFAAPASSDPVWNRGDNFDKYLASVGQQQRQGGRRAQQPRARQQQTANQLGWEDWNAPQRPTRQAQQRGKRVAVTQRAPHRQQTRLAPAVAKTVFGEAVRSADTVTRTAVNVARGAAEILPHPAGCPARLFCGCGAAVHLFGTTRPAGMGNLWHTSGWLRMPRAAPAPGMAAVNSRHVFVIEQVLGNGMVVAYDANSGGGKTRRHVRSLAGFTVVNPHAGRHASL